jgi:hypothetical protein
MSERTVKSRLELPESVNRAVHAEAVLRGMTKMDYLAAIVAAHVNTP